MGILGGRAEEITLAAEMGVTQMNIVGFDKSTIELSPRAGRWVWAARNYWLASDGSRDLHERGRNCWRKIKASPRDTTGWIGLDYHWMTTKNPGQVFRVSGNSGSSGDLNLPFVVHTRDALNTYEIIRVRRWSSWWDYAFIFRLFLEWAEKFVELGMTISFSGVSDL